MKKLIQGCKPVIQGFVLCAMVLQIVLGVAYIGSNFMAVPHFRDTTIYLEMAEEFVADEYTGILYPLLVKLCKSVPFIPYQIFVYSVQIVVGIYAAYHFVHTWTEKRGQALLCAFWLNTIPFVAQAHVTVLPHSLACSFLLLMLLEVVRGTLRRQALNTAEWAVLLCSYTILAQLTQGYLFAGSLLVIWAVFLQLHVRAHKGLLFFVSGFICVGIFVVNLGIGYSTRTPGYYGRIQNTLEARFFQRLGTLTLCDKYLIYMPEEISDCFSGEELDRLGRYPYQIVSDFGPTLEARYGKERANELYWELGLLGVDTATRDNVINIIKDTLSYTFPLGDFMTWQNGGLKGASGWNYQQFTEVRPRLASYYAEVCHFLWVLTFGMSLVACLIRGFRQKRFYMHVVLPAAMFWGLYAIGFALGGTDTYDYKQALLPMIMSYMPMCYLVIRYIF